MNIGNSLSKTLTGNEQMLDVQNQQILQFQTVGVQNDFRTSLENRINDNNDEISKPIKTAKPSKPKTSSNDKKTDNKKDVKENADSNKTAVSDVKPQNSDNSSNNKVDAVKVVSIDSKIADLSLNFISVDGENNLIGITGLNNASDVKTLDNENKGFNILEADSENNDNILNLTQELNTDENILQGMANAKNSDVKLNEKQTVRPMNEESIDFMGEEIKISTVNADVKADADTEVKDVQAEDNATLIENVDAAQANDKTYSQGQTDDSSDHKDMKSDRNTAYSINNSYKLRANEFVAGMKIDDISDGALRSSLINQISEYVDKNNISVNHELLMKLQPASLGEILISAKHTVTGVVITVMCESERTYRLLSEQTNRMANIMDRHFEEPTVVMVDNKPMDYLQQERQQQNRQDAYAGDEEKNNNNPTQDDADSFISRLKLGLQ